MKKLVRTALTTLWLFAVPKEPMSLVLVYPASTIALAQYCRLQSDLSMQILVLAVLWDFSLGVWLMDRSWAKPQRALVRLLRSLKDCRYSRLSMDQLLTPDKRAILHRESVAHHLSLRGLSYDALDYAHVYRITLGASGALPDSLGAFNIPFLGAVILVRDAPDDSEASGRFFFWHEMGHTLGYEFVEQSASQKGATAPLLTLILSTFILSHTLDALLVLSACFIAWGMVRALLKRREQLHRIQSETKADEFALQFLDEHDRQAVKENLEWIVPVDGAMSAQEHRLRLLSLQSVIQTGEPLVSHQIGIEPVSWLTDLVLTGANLVTWMTVLSRFLKNPTNQIRTNFLWAVIGLATLALFSFTKSYLVGFIIDFLFSGRIRWIESQFCWVRGSTSISDEHAG